MRVFQIEGQWGFDHLKRSSRPDPSPPGPGEVLLRMRAASLNYRDLVVPDRGYGQYTGELPLIPVSDGVGEVIAVGGGVTRVAVGDRVCPMFLQQWVGGTLNLERITRSLGGPVDGVMADYRTFPAEAVARVPAHLSDEQAATLPCAALTAWSALVTEGRLAAGDRLLVQGTGGVALFAVQFARLLGAHVTVISSSDEKLARARALGADAGINYRSTPEWAKATRAITEGAGFDHILELGGEHTLPQSLRCIRPGGTVSLIGVLSGGTMSAALGLVVTRQVRLQGITVGSRDGFEAMARAVGQHRLEPVIDRVFEFDALKEAMAYLKSAAHVGKVCLRH
jgi:NADPH:quinone reductase-like Zn-dependent oxidoreductase